jgi:guanylate kinase
MQGKLIIFSAPSGSGKTTIVRHLIRHDPRLSFSVSATTRKKRPDETEGKDYYFMSPDEFNRRVANDEFVEYEEVYEGIFYGTLKAEIDRIWATGRHVVFDVDVKGGLHLKEIFKELALGIFIRLPSIDTLIERLTRRSTESGTHLQERLNKAVDELQYASHFDKIIVNDVLEDTLAATANIIDEFIAAESIRNN